MKKLFLLLLSFTLVTGCTSSQATLPIRIGLLADSQITCPNSTPECVYRNKSLDEEFEKTIRPPALECYFKKEKTYLAEETLELALEKLSRDENGKKQVDVILYLGDGANSGGRDEIDTLFRVLETYRDNPNSPKIPMFMVIGNHEYLGVGNTPDIGERYILLNRFGEGKEPPSSYNQPLLKYEVLKKISEFNRQSAELNKHFKYIDNYDYVERNKNLGHENGLYLAGHLLYEEDRKNSVEIFLADSSDYKDTRIKPKITELAFYGCQGSISFEDEPDANKLSQISYLGQIAKSSSPDFRFIASHYHPDQIDRKRYFGTMPASWKFIAVNIYHDLYELYGNIRGWHFTKQHLKRWLLNNKRNYWLSAHTHRKYMKKPSQGRVELGGLFGILSEGSFGSVNIGSTTDYRAHVAVVEAYVKGKNKKVDKYVGFREIPLFDCNESYLQDVFYKIASYGLENGKEGASLLGLNKDYQKEYWTEGHTKESFKHLGKFISRYSKNKSERKKLVACLAFIAGAYENEKIPKNCETDQKFLKKLCKGK